MDEHFGAKHDIGYFATPNAIASEFVDELLSAQFLPTLRSIHDERGHIRAVDLCAGDGRLGDLLTRRLTAVGFDVRMTFVEIEPSRAQSCPTFPNSRIIQSDALSASFVQKFDVVIANPPFLALTKAKAVEMDLSWDLVVKAGRNLYGVALQKCMSICEPRGLVAVIAPFNWLTGAFYKDLRRSLLSRSSRVVVHAKDSRKFFPGVHQDIAFQYFQATSTQEPSGLQSVEMGFNGHPYATTKLKLLNEGSYSQRDDRFRIRIGPLVWNRERRILGRWQPGRTLVINSGNITPEGSLSTKDVRYVARQYAALKGTKKDFISKAPVILLKRTLRGTPGSWELDSCLKLGAFRCVAENHVIVVELPLGMSARQCKQLQKHLSSRILKNQNISGAPHLTIASVRLALNASVAVLEKKSQARRQKTAAVH